MLELVVFNWVDFNSWSCTRLYYLEVSIENVNAFIDDSDDIFFFSQNVKHCHIWRLGCTVTEKMVKLTKGRKTSEILWDLAGVFSLCSESFFFISFCVTHHPNRIHLNRCVCVSKHCADAITFSENGMKCKGKNAKYASIYIHDDTNSSYCTQNMRHHHFLPLAVSACRTAHISFNCLFFIISLFWLVSRNAHVCERKPQT